MILIPHNKLLEIKVRMTSFDSCSGCLVSNDPNARQDLPFDAMLCSDDGRILLHNISIYEMLTTYSHENSITMSFRILPW